MTSERYINRLILSVFLSVISSVCFGKPEEAKEKEDIIRIVCNHSLPPYEFLNEKNEPDGFVIDLIKEIMKDMNRKYEIEAYSLEECKKMMLDGNADIITTATNSLPQMESFSKSSPHSQSCFCLVLNKYKDIRGIKDLEGKNVVLNRGGLAEYLLTSKKIKISPIYNDDMRKDLRILSEGKADVGIMVDDVVRYYISKEGYNHLDLRAADLSPIDFSFLGAHDRDNLIYEINRSLYKLKEKGIYDRIYKKWFGDYKRTSLNYNLLFLIISIILLIIGVILIVNRLLRIKIKKESKKNIKLKEYFNNVNIKYKSLYNQYDTIFDSLPVGVIILDKHGNQIEINKKALEIYKMKDMKEYKKIYPSFFDLDFISNEQKEKLRKGEYIEYGRVLNFPYKKDEDEFYIRVSIKPIFNQKKEIINYALIIKDNSQLQNQKRKLLNIQDIFKYAIKSSNLIVWQYDVETELFTSYNEHRNQYNSYTKITIEDYLKYMQKEDAEVVLNVLYPLLRKGKDHEFNVGITLKASDGENSDRYNIFVYPLEKNSEGKVLKYAGLTQNVEKLYEYSESLLERNMQLNMALSAGCINPVIWDINHDMFFLSKSNADNPNAVNNDFLQSVSVEKLMSSVNEKDRRDFRNNLERLRSGECSKINGEMRYSMYGLSEAYYEYNFIKFQSKESFLSMECAIGYMQDITERKILRDLEDAKKKAEIANKMKLTFLASMSHEIRTPLNAIVGFSQLLTECDNREEKEIYLNIVNENNELLLRLIDDILDLSKIESDVLELSYSDFDLSEVFDDIYRVFDHKNENERISFVEDNPYQSCVINYDKTRMRQIITNFLTNAFKYTQEGTISMSYSVENTGVRIRVSDTGIGIPTDKQNKVFERFEKLDNFAQGTGLGLYICKEIAKISNGDVGFHSEENKGSEFWFLLRTSPVKVEKKE